MMRPQRPQPLTLDEVKRRIKFSVEPHPNFMAMERHFATFEVTTCLTASKNQNDLVKDDIKRVLTDTVLYKIYARPVEEFHNTLRDLLEGVSSNLLITPKGNEALQKLRALAHRLPPEYLKEPSHEEN